MKISNSDERRSQVTHHLGQYGSFVRRRKASCALRARCQQMCGRHKKCPRCFDQSLRTRRPCSCFVENFFKKGAEEITCGWEKKSVRPRSLRATSQLISTRFPFCLAPPLFRFFLTPFFYLKRNFIYRQLSRRLFLSNKKTPVTHTIASRDVALESFAAEYKKANKRPPLLVFDGESFWHVLHGSNLPKLFGGQFIQFRKKAEDFCKRLTQLGFKLAFIFGNSPISAETKAEERGKQTLLHLTSFYRQLNERNHGLPQINEIWPPCLRNVFPYYLRSMPNITVLQSLMDKDLSIACYAKEQEAAAIVSNDSDMLIYAVCPVMVARGLTNARNRVVMMYPDEFCKDVGLSKEKLPLLSVYLGNTETPITTSVVEASDGVIQRKIRAGDRGNVQDAIEYVKSLEVPICLSELAQDIFQQVDEENIKDVRLSLGRYILKGRQYPFDVSPMYKVVQGSPMIEPIEKYDVDKSENLEAFLEKIKKPVIECDIILKAKAWRRDFNIMHMSWPCPGAGIPSSVELYGPIFSAHATLLGKKKHHMIIPRFENEPIRLADPAFKNITLKPAKLCFPDGTKLPDAHELWISQDKRMQVMALITIWEATDLDFETLMTMVPATLTFLLVLHWVRRKCNMEDWEIYAFLATHVRMRHFTCDQIWRMDDIMVAKGITTRSIVLANVFSKLMGRFLWMVALCGSPFKTVDLLPDLMFDGMIFQKKYEQARLSSQHEKGFQMTRILDAVCNHAIMDSRRDRDRVMKLFGILSGHRVIEVLNTDNDRCNPIAVVQMNQEYEPNWYEAWTGNATKRFEAYEKEKEEKGIKSKKPSKSQYKYRERDHSISPTDDLHEPHNGSHSNGISPLPPSLPPFVPNSFVNSHSNRPAISPPSINRPDYQMARQEDPFGNAVSPSVDSPSNGSVTPEFSPPLCAPSEPMRQSKGREHGPWGPPLPQYNHIPDGNKNGKVIPHHLTASERASQLHAHQHALPPNTPKVFHPVGPGCGAPDSFVVTPEFVDPAAWPDMPPYPFEEQQEEGMPQAYYSPMVRTASKNSKGTVIHKTLTPYEYTDSGIHNRNLEQLARHNCMIPADTKRPFYENFAHNRLKRHSHVQNTVQSNVRAPSECASDSNGSNATDDPGYATMTNFSRTNSSVRGSNLSDRSFPASMHNNNNVRKSNSEVLSFSAAISSKCNSSSYESTSTSASDPEDKVDFDDDEDEEEEEPPRPMSKLEKLAMRSHQGSSDWGEDKMSWGGIKQLQKTWQKQKEVEEDEDDIPSDARELHERTKWMAEVKAKMEAKLEAKRQDDRRQKLLEQKLLEEKARKEEWMRQRQMIDSNHWSDSVRHVVDPRPREIRQMRSAAGLNFFVKNSEEGPFNGAGDDSDRVWQSAPEPEQEFVRPDYDMRRLVKESSKSEKFSYAQAAGASKEDKSKNKPGERAASFTLRNEAREFIPRCQSASSQADTTDSEFDGYQTSSDIQLPYRGQGFGSALAAAYGAYGYPRTSMGYGISRFAGRSRSGKMTVPIYYHDPDQGWMYGYGEPQIPRGKQMGDCLPPVTSASSRRAMLENMGMARVVSYNPAEFIFF
ncbi:Oidioi.mRNA.OKI2018_I69.XSR.g13544.t2.cds [Oikopleura dioica]|uniref:Oidioi.mRNA.OKI2018_I69.XSR.g13544.t2.cds n=1 Tax=Oikopleura dioica TaxID=34765 RepID=A0ABN7SFN3_OIKDI|nr:Oidioi.mRNA.OKI2018_I69.XSR.g13544.t2.cds [Oikopleura dioica]